MIISGTPDTWLEALQRMEAIGVDDLAVNFVAIDHQAALDAIALLGREVIPNLNRPELVEAEVSV